ncbi:hypothetical protein FNYG_12488 [Fusarium nygamai]|uniref:Uncharacterized protein n=1 Tax=Gibberella nygamai TaxID=42673 RepID=A0A2K0VVX4_GIBNY|nr:hypothetical protein FNYG_12488 [Fusarium nygamai]
MLKITIAINNAIALVAIVGAIMIAVVVVIVAVLPFYHLILPP